MAALDRARIWRFAIVAPFATSALLVSKVAGASLVSWDLSDLAPEYLVDWRSGAISLVLAGIAAIALAGGWVAGRCVIQRVFGDRRAAPVASVRVMRMATACFRADRAGRRRRRPQYPTITVTDA